MLLLFLGSLLPGDAISICDFEIAPAMAVFGEDWGFAATEDHRHDEKAGQVSLSGLFEWWVGETPTLLD